MHRHCQKFYAASTERLYHYNYRDITTVVIMTICFPSSTQYYRLFYFFFIMLQHATHAEHAVVVPVLSVHPSVQYRYCV